MVYDYVSLSTASACLLHKYGTLAPLERCGLIFPTVLWVEVTSVKNSHGSRPLFGWTTLTPSSMSQKLLAPQLLPTLRTDCGGWTHLVGYLSADEKTPKIRPLAEILKPGSVVLRRSTWRLPPLFLFFFVNDYPAICDNLMPRHIHICIYTFEHSPGGDTSRTTTIILVLIVSRCPVSYRTSLINPLLQRFSSLVASKSPFQYQGRKYPSWHCCHSHGPMTPVDFRASRNFKLGTSE